MESFLMILAFLTFAAFIVGMIKPKLVVFWTKKKGRGWACFYLLASIVLIIVAVSATPSGQSDFKSGYDQTAAQTSSESESTYKAACKEYQYSDYARNPDNYKGKRAKLAGQVIQVQENGNDVVLRLSVKQDEDGTWSSDDVVYVEYTKHKSNESRVLENDVVDTYGELNGIETYQSVLGSDVSVPKFEAQYIGVRPASSSGSSSST